MVILWYQPLTLNRLIEQRYLTTARAAIRRAQTASTLSAEEQLASLEQRLKATEKLAQAEIDNNEHTDAFRTAVKKLETKSPLNDQKWVNK